MCALLADSESEEAMKRKATRNPDTYGPYLKWFDKEMSRYVLGVSRFELPLSRAKFRRQLKARTKR